MFHEILEYQSMVRNHLIKEKRSCNKLHLNLEAVNCNGTIAFFFQSIRWQKNFSFSTGQQICYHSLFSTCSSMVCFPRLSPGLHVRRKCKPQVNIRDMFNRFHAITAKKKDLDCACEYAVLVCVGSVNSIACSFALAFAFASHVRTRPQQQRQVFPRLAAAPCFPSLSCGTKVFPRFVGALLKEIFKFTMIVSNRNTGLMDA